MRATHRILLLAALLVSPHIGYSADGRNNKIDPKLPPGGYGGCGQKMVIGHDGAVSYGDRLHLTQIRIGTDGSLYAGFPTEAGLNETIHLQPSNPENARPVWTASADGKTYRAKAIPHSEETYSFRLEVRREGRLVAGAQVFCAICKSRELLPK